MNECLNRVLRCMCTCESKGVYGVSYFIANHCLSDQIRDTYLSYLSCSSCLSSCSSCLPCPLYFSCIHACLPYVSPISPLYLPYISPICLSYISPIYLLHISCACFPPPVYVLHPSTRPHVQVQRCVNRVGVEPRKGNLRGE